VLEKVE